MLGCAVEGGPQTSTCWSTFNGLLDDTYQATQPLYWVHERYARMSQGGRWLVTEPFAAGIGGATISRTARTPEAAETSKVSVARRRLVIRLATLKAGDAYAIVNGP